MKSRAIWGGRLKHHSGRTRRHGADRCFLVASNHLLPADIDPVKDFAHIRDCLRDFARLLALRRSGDAPLESEHAVLGVKADVLFVEAAGSQRCLVVLLDGAVEIGGDLLGLSSGADGLHADLVGYYTAASSGLGHLASLLPGVLRVNLASQRGSECSLSRSSIDAHVFKFGLFQRLLDASL